MATALGGREAAAIVGSRVPSGKACAVVGAMARDGLANLVTRSDPDARRPGRTRT